MFSTLDKPHAVSNNPGEDNPIIVTNTSYKHEVSAIQNDVEGLKSEHNQPEQPSKESIISVESTIVINPINLQQDIVNIKQDGEVKVDNIKITEETDNKSIVPIINPLQNTHQDNELEEILIEESPLYQEESLLHQGEEKEKIEVNNVTVNIKGKNATICAEIGNYICKFTVPLRVLNKLHTLLGFGVGWATIVTSLAIAYWPDEIYAKDCSIKPNINVMQDLAKQIFMGTLIARMVPLPLIHMVMYKIAECYGKQSSFEKITTTIESLETTGLLTTGALACIGLNPLIPQTPLANYAYIPASMVAALPIANLIYSLCNPNHFRGAWQDYKKQYSQVKAIIFTILESFFGATTAASLTGIIGQVIYNTMINAAREVNVPQDEMNEVLIACTAIFATIGAVSVLHPKLWKGVNALSAGAGVFYAVYNMPVAVLACLYPKDFTPHNYVEGGWSLETIPGAFALGLMLSTTVATYRELSEITLKGYQALSANISSVSKSYFNDLFSFFKGAENDKELSGITYQASPEYQPLLLEEGISSSAHELAPPETPLDSTSCFDRVTGYICSFFNKGAKNESHRPPLTILSEDEQHLSLQSHA